MVGRIKTGDILLDTDLRDIDIVTTEVGALLFTTTGQNGGVTAWSLSDSGALARLADSAHFAVWGMAIGAFDAISLDGKSQLILSGTGSGKLIRYGFGDDGALSKAGKIDLPGTTTQNHDTLATATLTDGHNAVYTVNADTGVLAGWLSSGKGSLTSEIGFSTPLAPLDTNAPVMLIQATAGENQFLLSADSSAFGVRSYRIDPDTGTLAEKVVVHIQMKG